MDGPISWSTVAHELLMILLGAAIAFLADHAAEQHVARQWSVPVVYIQEPM